MTPMLDIVPVLRSTTTGRVAVAGDLIPTLRPGLYSDVPTGLGVESSALATESNLCYCSNG